jgi:hypothetical protein
MTIAGLTSYPAGVLNYRRNSMISVGLKGKDGWGEREIPIAFTRQDSETEEARILIYRGRGTGDAGLPQGKLPAFWGIAMPPVLRENFIESVIGCRERLQPQNV